MAEDKSQEAIERGLTANHLLENSLFREVMDSLDAQYHALWREAKTIEAREDCHRYVTLIGKMLSDIQSIATTGKLTQQRVDEISGKEKNKWLKNLAA